MSFDGRIEDEDDRYSGPCHSAPCYDSHWQTEARVTRLNSAPAQACPEQLQTRGWVAWSCAKVHLDEGSTARRLPSAPHPLAEVAVTENRRPLRNVCWGAMVLLAVLVVVVVGPTALAMRQAAAPAWMGAVVENLPVCPHASWSEDLVPQG